MTTGTTGYRQSHFEIKEPTRIDGEPTFESLKRLYDQLKIILQCVPSREGGGAHRHLGLVLTAVDYQLITLTPFVHPQDPGQFQIPPNMNPTPQQVHIMQQNHEACQQAYEKVIHVKAALKKFLVESIHPDFLLEIRNPITMKLEGTILQIMARLFSTYGNLTARSLMEKQQALVNYTYDPQTPIDRLFNQAQEFQEYASFHGTPQTPYNHHYYLL